MVALCFGREGEMGRICCIFSSCCCGWQSLEHGLYMFALVDLFVNVLLVCAYSATASNLFAGLCGLAILADICLAVGTKQGVRLLIRIT